ncbi:hypothetical protein [Streptomyces sp. CBMAI 2042]|uniref:hypothetical protein n=1 Tax=Streptomyces sp. CBMAI 2042 TaxID=2305222 RepID=UPI001F419318|nr:hypothetical protein [Streptomyces sp. CBMAI 2042]
MFRFFLKGMLRSGSLGRSAVKRHLEWGITLWISPEDAATLKTPGGRRGLAGLLQSSGYPAETENFVTVFEEILKEQKLETQAVIRLTIAGYSTTEIADMLEITNGAVRMRRHRFRDVIYQAARERRIRIPEQMHTKAGISRAKQQAGAA